MQNPGGERKREGAGIASEGARASAGVHLALVEPEIAPNVGAVLRLGACLGVPVHVVEPCGFPFGPRAWRRQAMDYAALAELHRHDSWEAFLAGRPPGRLVALAPAAETAIWDFGFAAGDILMLGAEGAGLPEAALAAADAQVRIPMQAGARSLNVAMAAAIAAAEAVRQLAARPPPGYALRRGRAADIPALGDVEQDAARRYAEVGYDFCLDGPVRDADEHARALDSGAHFVVEAADGAPVAFAMAWIVDGQAHLTEIAVRRAHQGSGLGRTLIAAVETWAGAAGLTEITLTTFRDVSWNAPLYGRLGWEEIAVGPDRPRLAAVIAEETAAGFAVRPRVAMAKRLLTPPPRR